MKKLNNIIYNVAAYGCTVCCAILRIVYLPIVLAETMIDHACVWLNAEADINEAKANETAE